MGFGHEWTFKKAFSPEAWASLEADVLILAKALPGALERDCAELASTQPEAAKVERFLLDQGKKMGGPIHPGFDGGLYSGPSGKRPTPRAIRFSRHPEAEPVDICNEAGEGCAKTGAAPHDRVLVGLLSRAEELAPGNVVVKMTDGEGDYWEEILQWVDSVFKRPMPAPKGAPVSSQRNAHAHAHREAREVAEYAPLSPTAPRGRGPRRA